ncbi:PDZ domain-containing protein, partial [bacterium]|nr:PDZ domain-containing protein [bacterium]
VITSLDDREISDSGNLRNLVAGTPIGKEVKLGIVRNGKKLIIPVKIGNPEQGSRIMASNLWDKLGVDVNGISEDDAVRFGIEKAQGGVIITRLDAKGPMSAAGFETGDILLQINDLPIENPEGLAGIVSTLDSGAVIVLFAVDHRTGRSGTIQIKLR